MKLAHNMEPLTSFALNLAAGIVLNHYYNINHSVKNELNKAFDAALKDWSKNTNIRNINKDRFKEILQQYIQNPDNFSKTTQTYDITSFLHCFNIRISEYQTAYNYLSDIKDENRYNEIKETLFSIELSLADIQENMQFDPREISERLDNLPLQEGKIKAMEYIKSQYNERLIDIKMKDTLVLVVEKIFNHSNELKKEIEHLRKTGQNEQSEILEKIKLAVEHKKAPNLSGIFENYKKSQIADEVALLKQLIKSSLAIYAYNETIKFYNKLLLIQPAANNYFNFAYFLQSYNFIDQAISNYQEALKIYRELAKENPRSYLPYVATTLNNLANLHSDRNEFAEAQEKYEEALKIRRALAKENPRTYLPKVAMTILNLSIFYLQAVPDKEKSIALATEAVEILLPLYKQVPYLENDLKTAVKVLEANGVDTEKLLKE